MWFLLLAILIASYPAAILLECLLQAHRRRAKYEEVLNIWRNAPKEEAEKLVNQWLQQNPRCGAAWFIQGVLHLRGGRTRMAARAFGMAHHCDTNLESAALFTFACLKAGEKDGADITEHIAKTWEEMKRPPIGETYEERLVLDALAATMPEAPHLSPLGRASWLMLGEQGPIGVAYVEAGAGNDLQPGRSGVRAV